LNSVAIIFVSYLMNCQNLKTIKNLFLFALFIIFFLQKSFAQLPDCSTISGTAKPGNNCLFYGLKLCQAVPGVSYSISSSNIVSGAPNHRVNCADLSDLPLCSQIDGTTNPGKNCVKECSDASFICIPLFQTRGQDCAVHNRDCIRFCDAPESGFTLSIDPANGYCTGRKCHQLASGVNPNPPTNCNLLPCNLLTPDELNETKFDDDSKKYCNGDDIKCYEFTRSQLQFTRMRGTNTMCKIHNCRTSSEECVSFANDDISKIEAKGADFVNDYKTYINAGYDITSTTLCTALICKPIVNRAYRCLPEGDSNPTTRNSFCDTSGDGAVCSSGYCYKTINCNLTANATEPECIMAVPDSSGAIGTNEDIMKSWFYRPKPWPSVYSSGTTYRPMEERSGNDSDSLCYTKGQMESQGWGSSPSIFGASLGYFHDYLGMDSRSPGMCDKWKLGVRGMGAGYLCGMNLWSYNLPRDDTAYHKGYVKTNYVEGDGTHKLVVCLRFNNSFDPFTWPTDDTCGERKCSITCGFGICTQVCGYDICRELTVSDANPRECEMTENMNESYIFEDTFSGGDTACSDGESCGCAKVIDGYLRLRAVKYKNYICTFLDVRGTLAYNPQYFTGKETLSDGTCIAGTKPASGGNCNGYDTNSEPGLAHLWRTMMRIPYIQNNRPSGEPRGYLDRSGQLFREQECIQASYRLQPPRTYNLANLQNSADMFTPPLYILNSRIKRGEAISPGIPQKPLGTTDFHYPELEVKFGITTQKMSLGIGYTGFEESGGDPAASKTITTTVNDFNYSAEIFVKKEYNQEASQPIFCLYRRLQDQTGAYIQPMRIGCVERHLPEIDNKALKLITPSINLRRLLVYPASGNTYNNSRITARYLSSSDVNSANCASPAECSQEIVLSNTNQAIPTCAADIEKYQVCVQREECSKLNIECIENEIALYQAKVANQPTESFITVRKNCEQLLLPTCNLKKGIESNSSATLFDPNPSASAGNPNAYGWFNEICVVSGLNSKLKKVIAYEISGGAKGKCLVSASSPYLTDGNSSTNCNEGGKAPNCLCQEAVDGVDPGTGYIARIQTPHEAGLCIDMPLPQTCPVIDYNKSPNSDQSDSEYILTSLNQTSYGSSVSDISNKVHISHKYRTEGKPSPDPITLKGHAEFPVSVFGMNDVQGECKSFWRNKTSVSGTSIPPKLNCINNAGSAEWEAITRDECIRYSCPEVATAGVNEDGEYQGGYGATETNENKGLSHGFATWPSLAKTNDFLESATATSCITGFKRVGATTLMSGGESDPNHAALYNRITGYSGGTLSTRQCNQLGQWQTANNVCQRIVCAAINPPTPTGSGDTAAWTLWENSGGATFSSANASRSSIRIQPESIAIGTCNNDLGFFQAPGGSPPSRECNHLGNWSAVINQCVTHCDAITDPSTASTSNNGYSYWNQVLNVPINGEVDGPFNGCVNGYFAYPYPALRNKYGQAYSLVDSGANYTSNIPRNVANDTRSAGNPERVCKSIITAGGAANVWTNTSSSCINKCVGADEDARIGAGKTSHPTRNGTIELEWPSTNFGQFAYIDNPTISQQDASHYSSSSRTNGYYSIARYCNPTTHKWDNPIVHCATNNGQISGSNALYNSPTPRIAAGSTTGNGTCLSNYYSNSSGNTSAATYTCSYKNSSNKIDEVYFTQSSGNNCQPYCQVSNGQNFGTGSTSFISGYYGSGSTLNLNCRSGFGSALIGSEISDPFSDCGRFPNNRSANGPYVTCQSSGAWSGISNDCYPCRSCTATSLSASVTRTVDCFWGDYDLTYNFSSWATNLVLSHNTIAQTTGITESTCSAGVSYPSLHAQAGVSCTDSNKSVSYLSGSIYY